MADDLHLLIETGIFHVIFYSFSCILYLFTNFVLWIFYSLARRLDKPSSALHGDWPWHVALYKNGQHVCDGTLIQDQWIMTTSACFQGQEKSKWIARFASIRLGKSKHVFKKCD